MTSSFSFWYVFDRPHWYDMYAFSFWSTFKSVFKSMRFRWKPSAHLSVDGTPERIELYAVSNENALVWTGTLWFLQFACNQEIKSRQVHCSLSLLRLSCLIAPSPAVTNDFSSSFFFCRWINERHGKIIQIYVYIKTKESVRKDGEMGKRSTGDRFQFCAYPHSTCFPQPLPPRQEL